jgi:hypothetical protein
MVLTEDIDDERIDHLSPKYKVSLDEIRIFFEKQLKKIL